MQINIEERAASARRYFHEGYNCCQAVVMAFSDIIGLSPEIAATAASGFGGGMGRMREVCGTVSGMTMLAGFITPSTDPADKEAKSANYALVQKFASAFREINGSIICRELLGLSPTAPTGHVPSERTAEYYKKRPCEEMVGIAATIVARHLQEQE